MTDELIKEYLTEWAKDWCNNQFLVPNPNYDPNDPQSEEYITQLPAGVELFLLNGVEIAKKSKGKTSESLGDYSVSMDIDALNKLALQYLKPYRKVRFT